MIKFSTLAESGEKTLNVFPPLDLLRDDKARSASSGGEGSTGGLIYGNICGSRPPKIEYLLFRGRTSQNSDGTFTIDRRHLISPDPAASSCS